MRKMIARPRLAAASVAFAAAMAAIASPAVAADVEPALKAALQRDLGLSEQQVGQYLQTERIARQQERALAARQGRNFAGSWIERGPGNTFRFVVATTSAAPQAVPAGVELRRARHDLAGLQASKAQLDAVAHRVPAGVYGWHVDVTTNAVVVSVASGAQRAGIDYVAASGADAGMVRFETMDSAPRPLATFQGGSEYLSNHDGSYYYCSVGFSVTHSTGQGFATAGHCGSSGDGAYVLVSRRTVSPIGAFAASTFPSADRAWVRVNTGHSLLASVSGYGKGDVAVRGSTEAPIGGALCRSGRTTGWKCGVIEAKNVSVTYPEGTVNNMTRTNVCAEGGDSGGSFITTAGQAQGVLSGGNYSCKGNQASLAKSYYQPIIPLLQTYNLTLKTTP